MLIYLNHIEHQAKIHQDQLRKEADIERILQSQNLWFSWLKPKNPPKVTPAPRAHKPA